MAAAVAAAPVQARLPTVRTPPGPLTHTHNNTAGTYATVKRVVNKTTREVCAVKMMDKARIEDLDALRCVGGRVCPPARPPTPDRSVVPQRHHLD